MTTITVLTNPSTWMIVMECVGHSLFFIEAIWWLMIDEFNCGIALMRMAFFSFLYHLGLLNIAPDASHVPFLHGLDYTGIFGLVNMIYFEMIMLPDAVILPLWVLLEMFTVPANWILYDTGYLPFGAVLSYIVIFAVTVLHRQHTSADKLPGFLSYKYWYVIVIGILGFMFALSLLFIGGNPGERLYEPVHGGAWHIAAAIALVPIIAFIVLVKRGTLRALIPFFVVWKEKVKKT